MPNLEPNNHKSSFSMPTNRTFQNDKSIRNSEKDEILIVYDEKSVEPNLKANFKQTFNGILYASKN